MTVKNLFLSAMMEYGIWNQIFEWEDNLENVRLVGTSFRNRHTSELKADLLGGFAKFRTEMHSFVKAVAQIWAEKAGISQSTSIPYVRHYNPRFVYFLPTFQSSYMYCVLWSYVWLVFKSGF